MYFKKIPLSPKYKCGLNKISGPCSPCRSLQFTQSNWVVDMEFHQRAFLFFYDEIFTMLTGLTKFSDQISLAYFRCGRNKTNVWFSEQRAAK